MKNTICYRNSKSRFLIIYKVFSLFFIGIFTFNIYAQEEKATHQNSGFIDPNAYYDNRNMAVFTMNSLVNLPARFQYFGTYNFFSNKNQEDLNTYYVENHVSWSFKNSLPIDLTQYWVSQSGAGNDALKYGVRFRLSNTKILQNWFQKRNSFYSLNCFLVDFSKLNDIEALNQFQHAYRFNFQSKKRANWAYISGFANQYHFLTNNKLSVRWVTEHQLGLRLFSSFYVVAEYRLNQFISESQGIGFGLEYCMTF